MAIVPQPASITAENKVSELGLVYAESLIRTGLTLNEKTANIRLGIRRAYIKKFILEYSILNVSGGLPATIFVMLLIATMPAIAHNSEYCTTCDRDIHGHIKRSLEAKHEFKRQYPCPANGKLTGKCPGYIIDHVKPLKRGGADDLSNMQWQTIEESKAKDAVE